jgi:tetratricopeptide (TPR) repeat protein
VRPAGSFIDRCRDCAAGRLLAACALLLVTLLAVPAPLRAAVRDEARLERADALLEDKGGWGEAIAIYRELLAADPAWVEPRHNLARVLAWRGDYAESLEHYDRLASATPPPADLAIERAEVLSWAGRTQEAAVAFEQLLAANPKDARAARGLARTHRWSGERSRADRWYTQSLALADDREAREEQLAMRSELRRELAGGFHAFFDSEDFSFYRTGTRFARDLDFDTRLYASSATYYVAHDREADAPLAGDPENLNGFEGRLGVERRIDARWKAMLEAGGRHWDHADAVPLARGTLEFSPVENTSFGLELAHDDMLERSYSLESVLRNVRRSSGKLSAWAQLTPSIEGYAESGGALLSDANAEFFAGTSLSWKPLEQYDVRMALAIDASRYQDYSAFYYSPEVDLGATLSLVGKIPITGGLAFTFDAGGGGGLSRELGVTETGPAYRVKAGFAFQRAGFSLDLDVARSQSVRAIAYTTHEVELRASWSF